MEPHKIDSTVLAYSPIDRRLHSLKFTYWQEDRFWLGYLQDHSDYWTQGMSLVDLKVHLLDLYHDLSSGSA